MAERSNQEMRKGSGKLLKTLTMRLSLVTASICGPGNFPLIKIPCVGSVPQEKKSSLFQSPEKANKTKEGRSMTGSKSRPVA